MRYTPVSTAVIRVLAFPMSTANRGRSRPSRGSPPSRGSAMSLAYAAFRGKPGSGPSARVSGGALGPWSRSTGTTGFKAFRWLGTDYFAGLAGSSGRNSASPA